MRAIMKSNKSLSTARMLSTFSFPWKRGICRSNIYYELSCR